MRKMLNTLFVTSEEAYLALENENVVVYRDSARAAQYPLQVLEGIEMTILPSLSIRS